MRYFIGAQAIMETLLKYSNVRFPHSLQNKGSVLAESCTWYLNYFIPLFVELFMYYIFNLIIYGAQHVPCSPPTRFSSSQHPGSNLEFKVVNLQVEPVLF